MNLYGVVTGTNDYALNVSLPPGFQLCIGDTITINPINANTGAATLSVGGLSPLPLTLNGGALTGGQLEAGKDRQCTFKGSGFACDNAGGAGGASFVGTSSNLTLGDGSAGIVPAGNFGNLSAADIPDHSAAKLTSGTLPAARLPGVLADVDTQGELLTAAGAQAAATGTPNGSKFLRDDNSWQTVSATDSSKIPLSTIDAKGDLLLGTANDTVGRQAVGANNTLLVANSGQTNGVEWRALAAGDIPANAGLAYGFLTMTADDGVSNSPTLITWDTSSLSGMTLSSNEVTIGETGHYEIGIKAIFAGMTAGTFCVLRLENWTSGSSVVIDLGRDAYPTTGTQCYVAINWRGPLASGTKLRVYQFCASGASGAIDGDGSTVQNTACFWDIRRAR